MNFFKRKRSCDEDKEQELNERERKKSKTIVSLVRNAGNKLKEKFNVALKALTHTQDIKSFLFNTPAGPLRSARYVMTPLAPFSAMKSLEWRDHSYYVLGSTLNVTESHQHEFKTGGGNYPISILPEHVRKYGSAFLNSDGGVLMAGVLDNGTVRGIRCNPAMRRRINDTVHQEFSGFLPKVETSLYNVKFVPIVHAQTARERREGRHTYVPDTFVIEITVKAGMKGELYETSNHQVFIRRESSVQGPLNPLQIRDIVIQKYREVLQERRLNAMAMESPTPAEEKSTVTSKREKSQMRSPDLATSKKRKVIVISP